MSYNVASGLLRSIGDSKTPLYFLIFSSVLNIILDVFFIVVVKAGTAGAAYATVISQGLAAVLSFIVMFRKYDILRTHRDDYYMVCNDIADNKTNREVNEMLVEELSELIKAVIKLERWDMGEITLRYNIDEIYNNLCEEMGDVIIMMLQFIYKNNIEYEKLLNKMCKKFV